MTNGTTSGKLDWLEALKTHGVPLVMLIGLAIGIWRAVEWAAENVAKPLVARQVQLIDKIGKAIEHQSDVLVEIETAVLRNSESIGRMQHDSEATRKALTELIEELRRKDGVR